ncbi:MAG: hypothetical protein EON87_00985 [Brevundimonas sp.]|nr:MAG: hypothetical protein EON87_00985 [Brevundimonas sp.]
MTKRKKNKPSSPAEIAARRAQLQDARAEAQRLKDQGAEVATDPRTGEITGAFKPDVVTMMARAGEIDASEESAVRRFEGLLAKADVGPGSALGSLDRVHGGDLGDRGIGAHIDAAKALIQRQTRMDPLTWAILRDLCAGNLLTDRWRPVIVKATGETNPKAQAGIIRQAFRVLAVVEEQIKRGKPANDDRPPDAEISLAG